MLALNKRTESLHTYRHTRSDMDLPPRPLTVDHHHQQLRVLLLLLLLPGAGCRVPGAGCRACWPASFNLLALHSKMSTAKWANAFYVCPTGQANWNCKLEMQLETATETVLATQLHHQLLKLNNCRHCRSAS